MLDRLVTRTWGDATVSSRRPAAAIVSYALVAVCGLVLALFGDGGFVRLAWGFSAVVFVVLAVTLAAHRSREGRSSEASDRSGERPS